MQPNNIFRAQGMKFGSHFRTDSEQSHLFSMKPYLSVRYFLLRIKKIRIQVLQQTAQKTDAEKFGSAVKSNDCIYLYYNKLSMGGGKDKSNFTGIIRRQSMSFKIRVTVHGHKDKESGNKVQVSKISSKPKFLNNPQLCSTVF